MSHQTCGTLVSAGRAFGGRHCFFSSPFSTNVWGCCPLQTSASQAWTVELGQCPQYRLNSAAYADLLQRMWLNLGGIVAGAIGGIVLTVVGTVANEKNVQIRVNNAKHNETSKAHRWILGYSTCASCAIADACGCGAV